MNRRAFITSGSMAAAALFLDRRGGWAQPPKATPGATVETTGGKIRGLVVDRVQAFKGVPFGASTAGTRRFLPPVKVQPWTGVRDTFEIGLRCPIVDSVLVPEWTSLNLREPQGEDCLNLSLWTPSASKGGRRPVMVWLHGGGYSAGSPNMAPYDGANLARKHDVVVVRVTHRLNAFGFAYLAELGGEQFAGASNVGMKDVILGLEWIRDNIASFGGDPSNVTIFGQSGGAGKVSTLLGMPAAQGLFHRAIAQSGSAVTSMPADAATQSTEALMSRLGLKGSQAAEFQKIPVAQLLDALAPRGGRGESAGQGGGRGRGAGGGGFNAAPVVDGTSLPHNVFDPAATAMSQNVPLLIGSTETEVTWNVNTDYTVPSGDAALRERVRRTLRGADDAQADQIIAIYRKGRPKADNLDLALIIETDASPFRSGTDTEAERKAALGKAPVYVYRFQWYSPVSNGRLRAMHCMDIPFVFENVDLSRSVVGDGQDRYALADKMSSGWVAFARSGNPNTKLLPKWDPFTAATRATMIFNNDCRAVNDPYRQERLAIAAVQPPRRTN
ncbi:MAG TPA: carboxylesterase family protein [Vicinamibacterales bacterium]|nr:carboxylesterase family protein [Vicinamibacterales bacterium]